jgi:acyl-CoA thioester hydrolase
MEEGRIELFRVFNPALDLSRWNLIVASARCDFLQQVSYAERLVVYTWIGRIGNTSFTSEHAIRNERGEWVARGQGVLVMFDYEQGRPVPIDPRVRSLLEEHLTPPEGVPDLRELALRS